MIFRSWRSPRFPRAARRRWRHGRACGCAGSAPRARPAPARHVGREDARGLVGIGRGPALRVDHCARDGGGGLRVLAHQVAAQAQHAAGAVLVVAFQIGGDLAQLVVLAQRVDERIVASDGVDLALPQHFAEQVLRILAPVHLIGIQAQLRHADGEEVLHRAGLVRHGHAPALQILHALDGRIGRRQQPHAAAVRADGQLDVEALLQRRASAAPCRCRHRHGRWRWLQAADRSSR